MTTSKKYFIIGGDKRYDRLAELFNNKGFTAVRISSPEALDLKHGGECEVILPYPLSPDGVSVMFSNGGMSIAKLFAEISSSGIKKIHAGAVKKDIRALAESVGLKVDDYGTDEALLQKNALCSAEGAIHILMRELEKTIHLSHFTVIGYGRIGRILSCKLKAMGAKVSAVARRAESLALMELDGIEARSFDELPALLDCEAIINTVPAPVLTTDMLKNISNGFILDLASSPGGVDRESANALGVKVIWALSIPGKYSPVTAAEIIFSHITNKNL